MGFGTRERSRSDYQREEKDDNNYRNKVRDSDRDREHRRDRNKERTGTDHGGDEPQRSTEEIRQQLATIKYEREQREKRSEVLAWVNKSRIDAEKVKTEIRDNLGAEKKKANRHSRDFEEEDDNSNLAGVKVLHGIDKVIEGGAVVLTLKDQSILADGDINDEVDKLENTDIAEQKRRDDAYKAAKKINNKYNEEEEQKEILPHYDENVKDEGVTLDEKGCLAEDVLRNCNRKKVDGVQGVFGNGVCYDLTTTKKISSEYYSQDEMIKFNKPKKVRSLRKKDKLDLDALEAEAVSSGLGLEDLGSRKDGKRHIVKEEQRRSEAQIRSDAYQTAYAKAEEASKALRQEFSSTTPVKQDEDLVFGDDGDEFYKELEKSRRHTVTKMNSRVTSAPEAIASLVLTSKSQSVEVQTNLSEEKKENKLVFREMEEFVLGHQLNDETHMLNDEDVHMFEEEVIKSADQEKDDAKEVTREVSDTCKDEPPTKEQTVENLTSSEIVIGKGLGNAIKFLQEQGELKGIVQPNKENKDKRKSKFVDPRKIEHKEINIDRYDKFGRVMTQKEAYRDLCHSFHGKAPGIRKQEKQEKKFEEEKKRNSYTTLPSVERMWAMQAETKKPYINLSEKSKPAETRKPYINLSEKPNLGQVSSLDRESATVEDLPQALTPLSGDRKPVCLPGIKRRPELGDVGSKKKLKPDLNPLLQ